MKLKERYMSWFLILFSFLLPTRAFLDVSRTKLQICPCDYKNCSGNNLTLPVLNHVNNSLDSARIIDFNLTFNASLNCHPKTVGTIVVGHDFFVNLAGNLINYYTHDNFQYDRYCLQPYGKEWNMTICLKPPRIPMCCSSPEFCPVPNYNKIPIIYGESEIFQEIVSKSSCTSHKSKLGRIGSHSYILYELFTSTLANSKVVNNSVSYTFHSEDEYCLQPFLENGNVDYNIFSCVPNSTERVQICKDSTCIHKCCSQGEVFNITSHECQSPNTNFHQTLYNWRPKLKKYNDPKTQSEFPENLKVMSYKLDCKRESYIIYADNAKDGFVILNNGSLYATSTKLSTPPTHYCVDNSVDETGFIREFALICFPDEPKKESNCVEIKNKVIPALLIISCVFLAITLFVYGFIPELHAKLHGKSLLSHVTALLLAYTFLAMLKLASSVITMPVCVGMGLVTQFSFLSAFFWLNIMCFDIWWTLRSMRPVTEANDSTRRRFLFYSAYAWGLPALIVGATLAVTLLPEKHFPDIIRPGFGREGCFFPNDLPKWIYFYSFISALTIANIFFFTCVTIILVQAQRANNSILRTPNLHHNKERIWVYLKLFVVMGITWICEVISFTVESCEYWLITDVINSLQGLFIFLIFICKRSVYHKLPCNRKAPLSRGKRNQGTCSYGSSSLSTQQTSLESSRKLSSSLSYHLSKLQRDLSNSSNSSTTHIIKL